MMYDRAGYGESDPNPMRSLKSEASDIEELVDKLQLGPKVYVIGVSLGCYPAWSCLRRIPNRFFVDSYCSDFSYAKTWVPCKKVNLLHRVVQSPYNPKTISMFSRRGTFVCASQVVSEFLLEESHDDLV